LLKKMIAGDKCAQTYIYDLIVSDASRNKCSILSNKIKAVSILPPG